MRDALKDLVGEPLTHMVRASPSQYLSFGEQKPSKNSKGEDSTKSDWGLMIGGSCHWCFQGPNGFSLGTDDFGPDRARRDEHAEPFYSRLNKDPIIVESIEIHADGIQSLSFSEGFTLTIRMPDGVGRYDEPWRFMPRRDDFRGQLVLKEFGLTWGFRSNGPRCTRCTALSWRRMSIKSRPGRRSRSKFTRARLAYWSRKNKRSTQ